MPLQFFTVAFDTSV